MKKTASEIRESIGDLDKQISSIQNAEENRDGYSDETKTKINDLLDKRDGLKADLELAERLERATDEGAAEKRKVQVKQEVKKEEEEVKKRFSITNFLNEARNGKLTGINAEMHQEAVNEARQLGTEVQNFGIPGMIIGKNEKRDITAGTATSGGNFIAEDHMGIIEYLENRLTIRNMGADFMTGLVGDVKWAREDSSLTASWAAENATASESNPTNEALTMSPERLTTFVDLSNQVLKQTSPSIDRRINARLGGALARGLDLAGIAGTGSSNQPTGILSTSGIGSVAIGTDGGAITWEVVVNLIREVALDNADMGSLGYLTNPKVIADMQTIEKASSTAQFIMGEWGGNLNGYNVGISNHVPSDLDKGSSTGVCSALIFGNWNDLVIGQWGGLDIMVNPYTKGKEGLTEVIAAVYADVAVLHPQSFAACLDITTT